MSALIAAAVLVTSTAYSPCSSGDRMADGTHTRAGSVAHNGYPLGKRLTIWPSPTGGRRFTVRDRIGHGTEVDFWVADCDLAWRWGRRNVRIREGWFRLRATVKVRPRRYEFVMGSR